MFYSALESIWAAFILFFQPLAFRLKKQKTKPNQKTKLGIGWNSTQLAATEQKCWSSWINPCNVHWKENLSSLPQFEEQAFSLPERLTLNGPAVHIRSRGLLGWPWLFGEECSWEGKFLMCELREGMWCDCASFLLSCSRGCVGSVEKLPVWVLRLVWLKSFCFHVSQRLTV